jgi:hypothetical protein
MMNAALRTFLNEEGRRTEARTPVHSVERASALHRASGKSMQSESPAQALTAIRCYGQQDAHKLPICDGPDVRHVRVQVVDGSRFNTAWCSDCRADAVADGTMVIADERPMSEYFARLLRAIGVLGDPHADHVLASHREALAHDVEAELADQ